MQLTQDNLQQNKETLDKAIAIVNDLAMNADRAMRLACRADMLDMRDHLALTAGCLHAALGELYKARAEGGKIEGGGVIRAGGT